MLRRILRRLRRPGTPASPARRERSPPSAPAAAVPSAPVPSPSTPTATGHRPELVLYKFDACPFCRRVARVIDELSLSIPTRDTRRDPSARAELKKATGRTQVPCLFIDGEPMLESEDIIDWLRANEARLAPGPLP